MEGNWPKLVQTRAMSAIKMSNSSAVAAGDIAANACDGAEGDAVASTAGDTFGIGSRMAASVTVRVKVQVMRVKGIFNCFDDPSASFGELGCLITNDSW